MGFLSFASPPDSGIQHQEESVTAFLEREDYGKGRLIIAESSVYWMRPDSQGFTVPYPAISLHAVSRDLSAFPQECLYLMIDSDLVDFGDEAEKMGDDDDSDESDVKISEIRFVPENSQVLETLFEAMSACQVLHPDPDEEDMSEEGDDEDEGVEEDYADADDEANVEEGGGDAMSGMSDLKISDQTNGHGPGMSSGQNGVSNLVATSVEAGQFDDADMEPDH